MKFRYLKANEVDVFPKVVKDTSCMVLLYKDARCDMNILDEEIGPLEWKREHGVVNNNLFCTVSIYNKDIKEWISKQDVGVESFTEKEKGQASDSFKRACFNWGIGRELYTVPNIWINLNQSETYKQGDKAKLKGSVKFSLSHIKTVEERIVEIEIVDQNNKSRFKWKSGSKPHIEPVSEEKSKPSNTTKPTNKTELKCTECNAEITDKVANYSMSKYKKELCFECQKKVK